ncbi:hypothetical protein LCGC14_0246280 [marine sediment metagenome]|uniref:Uncharacterized protein n=1 Tax=marine sediment metagenome TaxID=412755 RepID=A0A0F9UML6_9ZZZZ
MMTDAKQKQNRSIRKNLFGALDTTNSFPRVMAGNLNRVLENLDGSLVPRDEEKEKEGNEILAGSAAESEPMENVIFLHSREMEITKRQIEVQVKILIEKFEA